MSMEGMTGYGRYHLDEVKPEWERLERIEYCDQSYNLQDTGLVSRVLDFFRHLF